MQDVVGKLDWARVAAIIRAIAFAKKDSPQRGAPVDKYGEKWRRTLNSGDWRSDETRIGQRRRVLDATRISGRHTNLDTKCSSLDADTCS